MSKLRRLLAAIMLFDYGAYTFISGVFVSLSVNIFTGLCIEKKAFTELWNLYIASVCFFSSSVLLMYISAKINRYQIYITEQNIKDFDEKKSIVVDFIRNKDGRWWKLIGITFLSAFFGVLLLILNFIVISN